MSVYSNYNAVNTYQAFCYPESVTTKPENPIVVRVVYSFSLLTLGTLVKSHKKCCLLTNSPECQIAVVMP